MGTFAPGATTAEGRLNVPLGGQSTTRRRCSRGTPSTLRAYPARGIFSSASCTARCCSGRGSRGSRPRFDPRVVICVAPAPADAGDRPAWVELALRPGRPARVRVGAPAGVARPDALCRSVAFEKARSRLTMLPNGDALAYVPGLSCRPEAYAPGCVEGAFRELRVSARADIVAFVTSLK